MRSSRVSSAAAYILLVSAISFCVEAQVQLSDILIVDVEATKDVQVFYSIFNNNNPGVEITYTVYYGINLEDPANFSSNSSEAMRVDTPAGSNNITLPVTFPPATNVTVVVTATGNNRPDLKSNRPITVQTADGTENINIGAPMNVTAQRLNDNKALEVSWLPINSPLILSYDVEYRIFKTTGTSGFPSTIINSPGSINVKLVIPGVDNSTNYEVRVRGVAKDPRKSEEAFINGIWSGWYVSQVGPDMEFATGSATMTSCNAIICTAYLLLISMFLYF